MRQLLIAAGLLLPLGLDTFALAAALGVAGIGRRERVRVTIVFTSFETGMPIIGILLGRVAGTLLGAWATYAGIAFLVIAGALLLRPGQDEDEEARRMGLLAKASGLAIINLGLAVSIDELTIGLSAGLIGLPVLLTLVWIAVQATLATQVGLQLGSRLGGAVRERAPLIAGVMLIALAGGLLILRVLGGSTAAS